MSGGQAVRCRGICVSLALNPISTDVRLRWCEAEKAHRLDLQAFTCTYPPKELYEKGRGRYHPTPWEHEVQVHVHSKRPPVQLPDRILLGFDGDALAAYINYLIVEEPEESFIFVRAMACAYDSRGNGYGAEAYDAMFADLATLGWTEDYEVEANIHQSNVHSIRTFEGAGGYFMSDAAGGMEIWRLYVGAH
jgi:hypothetical protein